MLRTRSTTCSTLTHVPPLVRNAAEAGGRLRTAWRISLRSRALTRAAGCTRPVPGQLCGCAREVLRVALRELLPGEACLAYHSWYGVSRVAPCYDEECHRLHRTRLLLNNAAQQVLAIGLNLRERTRAYCNTLNPREAESMKT